MRCLSDQITNGFVDTWAADVPAMNMCDRYIEMRGNDGCSKRLIAISEDEHTIGSLIHAMIADPVDLLREALEHVTPISDGHHAIDRIAVLFDPLLRVAVRLERMHSGHEELQIEILVCTYGIHCGAKLPIFGTGTRNYKNFLFHPVRSQHIFLLACKQLQFWRISRSF